jgi:dihydrofolate reductase
MQQAFSLCAEDTRVFVVGGADIYAQSLNLVDTLYITEIQQEVDGDAHFPQFDKNEWQETSREICHQEIPQPLEYHFVTYRRK